MKVIVGTDNGLVKSVNVEEKLVRSFGTQTKGCTTECITFAQFLHEDEESEILFSKIKKSGTKKESEVLLWDIQKNEAVSLFGYSGSIKGIYASKYMKNKNVKSVISVNEEGQLFLHSVAVKENAIDNSSLKIMETKITNPIDSFRMWENPMQFKIAVGGKENDLSIWEITESASILKTFSSTKQNKNSLEILKEKMSNSWKAKNVSHDMLDMRVPVWITDIQFFPQTPGNLVAVGTYYHHIRIYDTKAQRKPIVSKEVSEHPITSIAIPPYDDGKSILIGDTVGNVVRFDTRTNKISGKYKGSAGSVKSISVPITSDQDIKPFATVGLDRYLRVYDFETRKMLHKLYLKQRLSSALILNAEIVKYTPVEERKAKNQKGEEEEGEEDSDSEINDDDIFEPVNEKLSEEEDDEDEDGKEEEDDSDEDSEEEEEANNSKKRKSRQKQPPKKAVKKNKNK